MYIRGRPYGCFMHVRVFWTGRSRSLLATPFPEYVLIMCGIPTRVGGIGNKPAVAVCVLQAQVNCRCKLTKLSQQDILKMYIQCEGESICDPYFMQLICRNGMQVRHCGLALIRPLSNAGSNGHSNARAPELILGIPTFSLNNSSNSPRHGFCKRIK